MSDNLTVTIGADSSKLRAELALVKQSSQAAQKELASLAAAFNKTGADADRLKLDAKAKQLDQYKRSAASLNAEIAKLSPTFTRVGHSAETAASGLQEFLHAGRGLNRVVGEFSSVGRGLESITGIFSKTLGGFAGGIAGVAIFRAFDSLREQINKVRDNLIELRDTAAEIGVKPIALQAAREVVGSVGQDANAATNVLKAVSAQIDDVRKKSTEQVGQAGVSVLRGGGAPAAGARTIQVQGAAQQTVTILRGGTQAAIDFSKALEALGIDLSNIPVAQLDPVKITLLALQRFMEVSKTWDPTALNLVAKGLGSTADALKESAPAQIAKLQQQIEALQKTARGATPEEIAANNALIASQQRVKTSWEEAMSALAKAMRPVETAWNNMWASMGDNYAASLKQLSATTEQFQKSGQFFDFSGFHQMTADISRWWDEMLAAMSPRFSAWKDDFIAQWTAMITTIEGLWTGLTDTISGVFNTISGWLSKIGASLSSAAAGARDLTSNVVGGVGMAAGGMVRGGGTGTSDSILARLSNGEFVMRAAAVRHWGSDFLAGLNNPGFALGGLVSGLPRFADGGIAAAGGTPVHLHLGGGSFALAGHDSVVSALVVEAHRQQMRSAGTKPSWFAARPGGQ